MANSTLAAKGHRRSLWIALGLASVLLSGDRSPYFEPEAASDEEVETTLVETAAPAPLKVESPEIGLEAAKGKGAAEMAAEKKLRTFFTEGQFVQALQLVREQELSESLGPAYKQWLKRQTPVLKMGWAWQMIREKNCGDAIPLLEEAHAASPQPLALKGIGWCYLQSKDWWTATGYLERYLETKPSDPEAFILLAETKESLGAYDEALQLTQKAKELETLTSDETKDLEKRETSLAVRAKEGFDQGEMQVSYFTLRYQIPDHQNLVQGALETMGMTARVLMDQLGIDTPPESGIEVIFHRSENFQGATHSPSWAGGLYDGRIRIPVSPTQEMDEEFAKRLRHEVTHALLNEQSKRQKLPTWFQEGLAQVAECPNLCWNFRFLPTEQPFLPIESFDASFLQLSHSKAQMAYKQSMYMMQVLYSQEHLRGLRQIIEQIPQQSDLSSEALLQSIGKSFADLHESARLAWNQKRSF